VEPHPFLVANRLQRESYVSLQAALAQTGWEGSAMTASNWRDEIRQRIEALDWERARADVRPFLERERDIALVAAEALGSLLDAGAQRRDGY
jgi:hypothetical protein